MAWIGYDPTTQGSFEYLVADASAAGSGSATISKPTIGSFMTVTSNGDSDINQTKWIVKSVGEKQMNTDATKITVQVTYYPLITS